MTQNADSTNALRQVVEYVLSVHEWCEQPLYLCSQGHRHPHYCIDRADDFACEGCQMQDRAIEAIRNV